jgi:hypothetical protein
MTSSHWGFSPLSTITASPVCTPPTLHSKVDCFDFDTDTKEVSSNHAGWPCSLPTWTSTPPTPSPQKVIHKTACVSRRRSAPLLPPSTSFPAMLPQRAPDLFDHVVKHRTSLPAILSSSPFHELYKSSSPAAESSLLSSTKRISKRRGTPLRVTTPEGSLLTHPRPRFHISPGHSSDHEDDAGQGTKFSQTNNTESGSNAESSSTDHSSEGPLSSEMAKDNDRRYYALMELLATEVGYLMDLRTLVNVSVIEYHPEQYSILNILGIPPSHWRGNFSINNFHIVNCNFRQIALHLAFALTLHLEVPYEPIHAHKRYRRKFFRGKGHIHDDPQGEVENLTTSSVFCNGN